MPLRDVRSCLYCSEIFSCNISSLDGCCGAVDAALECVEDFPLDLGLDKVLTVALDWPATAAVTLGVTVAAAFAVVFGVTATVLSAGFGFPFAAGLGDASEVKSKAVETSSLVRAIFFEATAATTLSTAGRSRFRSPAPLTSLTIGFSSGFLETGVEKDVEDKLVGFVGFFGFDGAPTFINFLVGGCGDLNGTLPMLFN